MAREFIEGLTLKISYQRLSFSGCDLAGVAFDNKAGVVSAETEGIAHGYVHLHLAGFQGYVVQIALGVRCFQIDRRRYDSLAYDLSHSYHFDTA